MVPFNFKMQCSKSGLKAYLEIPKKKGLSKLWNAPLYFKNAIVKTLN
jgi:hypothetical protein